MVYYVEEEKLPSIEQTTPLTIVSAYQAVGSVELGQLISHLRLPLSPVQA